MFKLKKKDHCRKCMFSELACESSKCNHYYTYQSIVDRHGELYGIEILSRPINLEIKDIEKYFDEINFDESKKLINHQMANIKLNEITLTSMLVKIFLNIDRILLLDEMLIDALECFSDFFRKNGFEIVYEITERSKHLDMSIQKSFYRMVVNDILFAADDFSFTDNTHNFINNYSYVKIEMNYIKEAMNDNYNKFVDDIYFMSESGIKLIAEKIQSENDFLICKSLPFNYFQGFYIGHKRINTN